MPLISVIIPVYRVDNYVSKSIESVLNQSISDFELIIIDDGSPDKCGAICDRFEEQDDRIVVIHKNNAGVSSARNLGILLSTGSYIVFIDADDYIEKNMLEKLYNTAVSNNADVTICGINYCKESGEHVRKSLQSAAIYDNTSLLLTLFDMPNPIGGGVCNKLFRNTCKQILFPENISIGEDTIYLFDRFSVCNRAIKIHDCLYNVIERSNSATRSDIAYTLYKSLESYKLILAKAMSKGIVIYSKAIDKFLDNSLLNIKQIMDLKLMQ